MTPDKQSPLLELVAVLAAATLLAIVLTFPFAMQMTHVGRVDNFVHAYGRATDLLVYS